MGGLMSDPEIAAGLQNPKVMKAFQDLMSGPGGPMGAMSNPAKLQEMMADPEVSLDSILLVRILNGTYDMFVCVSNHHHCLIHVYLKRLDHSCKSSWVKCKLYSSISRSAQNLIPNQH